MLHLGVITVLPEMFSAIHFGVTGKAIQEGKVCVDIHNIRDFSEGNYRQIDDKSFGGGPGMVMLIDPITRAIKKARENMPPQVKTVFLSPQGKRVQQSYLNELVAKETPVLFLAGRYEGVDERLIDHDIDEEWSLGDFVLSGGEFAAMAFMDAMIRLVPNVLGHQASAAEDSFMNGLLDYPHYTRPAQHEYGAVPEVLIQGNHKVIERWRHKQALGRTWLKRPDLLEEKQLTDLEQSLLSEFQNEYRNLAKKTE